MGRPEEALPWAEGQLALLESLWPENRGLRPHLAAAHRDRGYLLLELGQLAAARQAQAILGQPEDHMERLLRFVQDREEPLAEYWQDVSAASCRAAEWLCALEDSSVLAEARSYALRDVELTRLLHQTDPAGTAEDLAASLRQLAGIKKLQGENDEADLLEEIRELESGKSE